jgi:protein-tyrosine kinase
MEQIRQAVERAKASATVTAEPPRARPSNQPRTAPAGRYSVTSSSVAANWRPDPTLAPAGLTPSPRSVDLDPRHLERHRIIAHNASDPRSKAFDMLRTQVLQTMDQKKWCCLAVTSPTPGCGKTVTAINLALSIARQPDRSVLLVDLDLQRPQVANQLDLKCRHGLLGVLEGRTNLPDAIVQARIDSCEFLVLPTEAPTVHSSELIATRTMSTVFQDIRPDSASRTVIFDMPPMLSSDDVIAMLPRMDCVLLVAAVGISTQHEIKECNQHLQSSEVVRLVLNKSNEVTKRYY